MIVAHDHARRSYPAQITLARVNRRVTVTNLIAPELQTILMLKASPPRSRIRSRAARPAPPPPAGLKAGTTRFLSTYLPYTYGQLPARRVKNASPQLLHHLERQPPHVPPAVRSLHPALRSLAFEPDPIGGWAAIVTVNDRHQSYQVTIKLGDTRTGAGAGPDSSHHENATGTEVTDMPTILTILITLLASQLLPAPATAWIKANRGTTIALLAAAALLTGLLTITTASSGEAPITPRLLQQAARAAEADGGGYDYTCQLYGAPRQIQCQGQGASVSFLVSPSGQLQAEPGTGQ